MIASDDRTGRRLRAGLATVAALLAPTLGSGCSRPASAERVPPPVEVAVAEARSQTVPITAEPIGTTRALQEVSVRARVRGFLQKIGFEEGGEVKAGQLLFVIEEEPFKAKVAEAEASLAQAEATLQKAKNSKSREIATAQLALDQAISALNKVEEQRQYSLIKRNAASQQDVDRAVAVRQKSDAQVDADRASLEQTKADYETNILGARADVEAAKARLDEAKIELSYCRMYSPIDGRIGLAQVKVGNLVGTAEGGPVSAALGGQQYTELAVVRQLDPMGVDIQVASRYLDRAAALLSRGLGVEVYRPGLGGEAGRHLSGKATAIDNSINPTTSTFLMRAEVANPSKALLPGEYVKLDVKVGEIQDAVVVPEQAVVETQAGPTVFVVDGAGKVSVATVKASIVQDGLRVIESGVSPGQRVVVEGLQMIRPGMTVKTRTAEPPRPAASSSEKAPAAPEAAKPPAPSSKG